MSKFIKITIQAEISMIVKVPGEGNEAMGYAALYAMNVIDEMDYDDFSRIYVEATPEQVEQEGVAEDITE